MTGYQGDDAAQRPRRWPAASTTPATWRTRDADGYITYVGRTDDVFKACDYKISPFEVESVLIEHPAVAEAAVVPAPDAVRLAVPKAYVALAAGSRARRGDGARSILAHAREQLPPCQRVRRHRVRRAAQDDLGQDPPGRAAGSRGASSPTAPAPPEGTSGATTSSPTSRADPAAGRSGHPAEGDAVDPSPPCSCAAGTAVVVNGASAEQVRVGSASRPSTRRPLTSDTSS